MGNAVSGKFPLVYVTPEKFLRGGLLAQLRQIAVYFGVRYPVLCLWPATNDASQKVSFLAPRIYGLDRECILFIKF